MDTTFFSGCHATDVIEYQVFVVDDIQLYSFKQQYHSVDSRYNIYSSSMHLSVGKEKSSSCSLHPASEHRNCAEDTPPPSVRVHDYILPIIRICTLFNKQEVDRLMICNTNRRSMKSITIASRFFAINHSEALLGIEM